MEKKYSISDTARQLSVETHVLRYWEEELELEISRNAQGHRYYLAEDITMLKQIQFLKDQGFRLQAIKLLLPDLSKVASMDPSKLQKIKDQLNDQVQQEDLIPYHKRHTAQIMPLHPKSMEMPEEPSLSPSSYDYEQAEKKLKHFEAMMRKMIRSTVEEITEESEERVCEKITNKILKELDYLERQKDEILEKQLGLLNDILEEIKLDNSEAAVTTETISKRQRRKRKRKEKEEKKKIFAKSQE